MTYLYRIFPFLNWISELKNPQVLKRDIIAGLSVSFILIPQSMAYAQLAGLPIEIGLYTAFIPVIIAALFGSSPQMST
jgi:SulP family sulfate permease